MNFIKQNKKWFGLGACVVALIGMFLKFVTANVLFFSQSVTYIETDDGKIALVAIILSAILMFIKGDKKFSLIPLIGGLGLTIYDGIDALNKLKDAAGAYGSVNLSAGFFVVVIGFVLALVLQFIKKDEATNPSVNQSYTDKPINETVVEPKDNEN